MLVAGYWLLGAGYWVLDTGYWVLDTGCWLFFQNQDAPVKKLCVICVFVVFIRNGPFLF